MVTGVQTCALPILFRLDPELVVTNKPEVAVSILTGLGQWDESSKEG